MKEGLVDIWTPNGPMDAFYTQPQDGGPFPGVIVYMDIWGLREELFDIARRIATVGYHCVVPNLYYRQGRIRHEFRDEKNRMISLDRLDPEEQEIVRAPWRQLTNTMAVDDTASILEFFDRSGQVSRGSVGVVGYCMGGRYACCVAGRYPERIRASASLHGTSLVTDRGDSPHLLAGRIRGELYCGFAELDKGAPPAMIRAFEEAVRTGEAKYRFEVHQGAQHGYALPERDIHDKCAANRDWEIIFAMFHRQIPPYAIS